MKTPTTEEHKLMEQLDPVHDTSLYRDRQEKLLKTKNRDKCEHNRTHIPIEDNFYIVFSTLADSRLGRVCIRLSYIWSV